ncbi:MAG TPA: tail fiber domain-containing protein [Bacteroidales bacterium]|nr:tail fiber domain-containing protein [Bacteroidales bacterium]HRT90290.1 tail fiber domain-containing protein [Bacteroidales bacterium]
MKSLLFSTMKTRLIVSVILTLSPALCTLSNLEAQVPQGFNYQAIARDASGNPIQNATLKVKLSILSDTTGFYGGTGGTYIWEEEHSNVKTNSFGMFTVVLGSPAAVKVQGTAPTFSSVNWSVANLYVGTKIAQAPGYVYKVMGSAKLWSVPYSMMANDISGALKKLTVTGETSNMEEALFEVKNKNGQTVFAVYNEGVRIYVDDGDAKGVKGGFAIGGFDASKAPGQEYFRVTRDSTRVYVNQLAKGNKGGFAIGGFDPAKGPVDNFLDMNPDNYFIGHKAGYSIKTGLYNSFVGYESGLENESGSYNSFFGYQTGRSNVSGNYNTFIGNLSGLNHLDGSANTFIGTLSGRDFTTGSSNTYLGAGAGAFFKNGSNNIFIGNSSGLGYNFPVGETGGSNNIAVGNTAGFTLSTGSNNVLIGNYAGAFITSASNNVLLGYQSGYLNSTGNYNVFMGFQSGYANSTGYNNSFIGYQSGLSNTSGYSNIFIGTNSGNNNTDGYFNTFIGNNTGFSNTSGFMNVFIGNEAGNKNTTASRNVFIGPFAGRNNTTGDFNVFIGQQTGEANTTGSFNLFAGRSAGNFNTTGIMNTFLGINAGNANTTGRENVALGGESAKWNNTGSYNVSLGSGAGFSNTNGNYNTMIGYYAGASLASGSGNIFIGPYAGGGLTNTSSKLFIDNSAADYTNALIYGDFDLNQLRLNGNITVNRQNFSGYGLIVGHVPGQTPTYEALWVYGNAYATGNFVSGSDERWKKDIVDLGDVLPAVKNIRSVYYNWKTEEFKDMDFSTSRQIGFIAQDVEKYFPEVMSNDHNGYKLLDYSRLTVVLLQAVKEQQKMIESSVDENRRLKSELQTLRDELEQIKASLGFK